jgi:hypothetical protein
MPFALRCCTLLYAAVLCCTLLSICALSLVLRFGLAWCDIRVSGDELSTFLFFNRSRKSVRLAGMGCTVGTALATAVSADSADSAAVVCGLWSVSCGL